MGGPDLAVRRARREDAAALSVETLTITSDPGAAGFYQAMGCAPAGETLSEVDPERMLPVLRAEPGG